MSAGGPKGNSTKVRDLDGVQGYVSPVQAVAVVVKVQGHGLTEAGEGQGRVGAGGQVVAVDGAPHGVQDELVALCKHHTEGLVNGNQQVDTLAVLHLNKYQV